MTSATAPGGGSAANGTQIAAALGEIDRQLVALSEHLWSAIPRSGRPISNRALQRLTGTVTNDDYRAARDALRLVGLVEFGGGRSGSVFRAEQYAEPGSGDEVRRRSSYELSLYGPIAQCLEEMMLVDPRFDGAPVVSRTGLQGKRKTGGACSRPDITVVAFKKFRVLAGGHLEVHTYEVKTGAGFDVTALHEARSHRRKAHRSYVLVAWDNDADLGRVESSIDEARDLGVGLTSFRSVEDDWYTWYEPPIHLPDPIELDGFLATQLPLAAIETIRGWSATPALGGTD